jgi:hypothetical protein
LDFTQWLESIKPWTDLIQLFGGVGLAAVVLAYLKATVERRQWKLFKQRIDRWMEQELEADRHPRDLSDDEWKIECENNLFFAGFTPEQIQLLLDTAVIVAKGRAAARVFM